MSDKLADWTKGAEAIVYQSCGACGGVQYFHRSFCAACGAPNLVENRASGAGKFNTACDLNSDGEKGAGRSLLKARQISAKSCSCVLSSSAIPKTR